jgi:hypothetical protein
MSQADLAGFKHALDLCWRNYDSAIRTPIPIEEQLAKHSEGPPCFLVFAYVPLEGAVLLPDFSFLNESQQDARALGYNFISAVLISVTAVRKQDSSFLFDISGVQPKKIELEQAL